MESIDIGTLLKSILENSPTTFADFRVTKHHVQRELFLEDVDEDSCREIFRSIVDFNRDDKANFIPINERKPINIYINSCGGNVTDGFLLMDAIQMSKTPVITTCVGIAYSMGGLIFLSGHHRRMYPKSSLMIHSGSASLLGDIPKVKDTIKFIDKLSDNSKNFVLSRTKITKELYEQKESNDWYITADECLELGITDEIATTLF